MTEIDFNELQHDVGEWAEENFGEEQPPWWCIKGAYEELGELFHSDLKRDQGIRLDDEDVGPEAERDAIGDVLIYLMDFSYRAGYDLSADGVDRDKSYVDKEEALTGVIRGLNNVIFAHETRDAFDDRRLHEDTIERSVVNGFYNVVSALEGFCECKGYDFDECVADAWHGEVKQRDWDADMNGVGV